MKAHRPLRLAELLLEKTRKPVDAAITITIMAFVSLGAVGVLRPQLPDLARQHWTILVIVLAFAASGSCWLSLRRIRPLDPYPWALGSLFSLVLAAMYLQPQRVASDGIFYYAPLRSLIVDGDLDFENEYRILGAPEGYFHRTPTGRLPNNFSIGPALVWTPFYLMVHAVAWLGAFRPTGMGYPYFTAVATATSLVGFLGVLWLYKLGRAFFDPSVAFASTVLLWLGSFHFWYMVFEPSMPHALAMASVSGFFLLCQSPEGWRRFVLIGVSAGLILLIRWQNLVFLPAGVGWILGGGNRRPRWKEIGIGMVAAAVVFLPQIIYWKLLYGRFFLVPQGGTYIEWAQPQFEAVLFSSRHGLFSWSPLLWVGAIGFVGFFRKSPAVAAGLLGCFAGAIYVNASVCDWWAGASFGARRFDGALPAFGLGLGTAMERMLVWTRQKALVVACALLAPFCIWALLLVAVSARGGIPPDGAVSFRQAAGDGLEIVYQHTGYPFSWPGAVAAKLRSGLPFAAYDLAGAQHLSNNVEIRMGDNDALYLGSGWSLARRGRGKSYREGSPKGALLFVALREPAPYELTLEGPAGEVLEVSFNRRRLARAELGESGRFRVAVPSVFVQGGINEIGFSSVDDRAYSISRVVLVRPGNP